MEPIKIEIEVSFKETTLKVLKDVAAMLTAASMVKVDPEECKSLCDELKADIKPEPAEAPAPEPAPAKEPEAEEISPETVMALVKSLRQSGVTAKAIKEVFAEFGIASSKDCPAEKRGELVSRLQSLGHAE